PFAHRHVRRPPRRGRRRARPRGPAVAGPPGQPAGARRRAVSDRRAHRAGPGTGAPDDAGVPARDQAWAGQHRRGRRRTHSRPSTSQEGRTVRPTSPTRDLTWLLDDLVARVAHAQCGIVLSNDGLLIASSQGLSREDAEHLAAAASGMQSLARGTGRYIGGGAVRQTVIELEHAFFFISSAGDGACLAVQTAAEADVGLDRKSVV